MRRLLANVVLKVGAGRKSRRLSEVITERLARKRVDEEESPCILRGPLRGHLRMRSEIALTLWRH